MLAKPIKISSLELENRIVKTSMVENMASEHGQVTDRLIKFYESQARGSAGILITAGAYIQKNGKSVRHLIGAYEDSLISRLRKLPETVHKLRGKIVLQIYHCGGQRT
jgi:2,4-dienoyl-CoA reductase-like NADH-dependent reductase (Old Yellow Enzyme family)